VARKPSAAPESRLLDVEVWAHPSGVVTRGGEFLEVLEFQRSAKNPDVYFVKVKARR